MYCAVVVGDATRWYCDDVDFVVCREMREGGSFGRRWGAGSKLAGERRNVVVLRILTV